MDVIDVLWWLWSWGHIVVVVVVVVVVSLSIVVGGGPVLWFSWVVVDKEWWGWYLPLPVPVNGNNGGHHHHLDDMALPHRCCPACSAAEAGDMAWPCCCRCRCCGRCSLWAVDDCSGWLTMVVGGDSCRRGDGAAGGVVQDGGSEGRGVLSVVDDTKSSAGICRGSFGKVKPKWCHIK